MNAESESTPEQAGESKIVADDDWKQRVKAENAALDASLKAATPAGDEGDPNKPVESAPEAVEESAAREPTSDEAAAGESAAETSAAGGGESLPLPPATFEMLVSMFSTQAMVALGVLPNPASGKPEKSLDLAKHFIDLLGVLETKTAGNLEPREKSLLESSLHELRMAYIEAAKK